MSKIHIITDTDSSLPADVAAAHSIVQVPITIQFGDETYQTGIDIDDKTLFEKIDSLNKLPTTAAPSPAAFIEAFDNAYKNGAESIICICVGSKISRTYQSALQAAEEFPGKKISVVDSEYLSLGQGLMVLAAAKAVEQGASHEEAVQAALSLLGRLHLFGALPTLKYLALGGRIKPVAAGMADLLNIRPILTMRDGKLDLLEKVRTNKVAFRRLVELLTESADGKEIQEVGIIHINNLEGAIALEKALRESLKIPPEVMIVEFTPGLSVHAGAGMVAAVLLTKN
ncbi:MAG: DegV family protein [Anaerolineaceae bacterium]|nr:DegV family protein [Anaerolineaceae bacterium]